MGPETPATGSRFEQVSTATPMAAPPLTANLSTPVWSSQKERTPVVWYVDGHEFTSNPLYTVPTSFVPAALNL